MHYMRYLTYMYNCFSTIIDKINLEMEKMLKMPDEIA